MRVDISDVTDVPRFSAMEARVGLINIMCIYADELKRVFSHSTLIIGTRRWCRPTNGLMGTRIKMISQHIVVFTYPLRGES